MESNSVLYELKNSKNCEQTPVAMEQIFSAIGSSAGKKGFLQSLIAPSTSDTYYSLEIVSVNSAIRFFIGCPAAAFKFIESQVSAHYPNSVFLGVQDYIPNLLKRPHLISRLVQSVPYYFPLKTHKQVQDIDMLSSVLGQMAKLSNGDAAAIQFYVVPISQGWRVGAQSIITKGIPDPADPQKIRSHPQASLIETKIAQTGLMVGIRIAVVSEDKKSAQRLTDSFVGSFGVFAQGEGNSLVVAKPLPWQVKKVNEAFVKRNSYGISKHSIFGSAEMASLWHPPGLTLSMIKNISWGSQLTSQPPENLPVATADEEEKKKINFFARTEFKNKQTTFGIKKKDRRKHIYIIGKTGTGKSTMIANMAINDMRNRQGVAVIDPHGDLSEIMLEYIPSHRINDVAYLDPSDTSHPFHLNPLEVPNRIHSELVASGIVSIFHKLYHYSWGPRLEYILRNAILTLVNTPQTTLLNVPELLTDKKYRQKLIDRLDDKVLINFWNNEFDKMNPKMQTEAISPILNKVGQFLSSKTIRTIIGSPKSTINLETMMDEGKIVIINLSQGKLGEDNSALLGSMVITKFQLAAMNRAHDKEESRRDFYLYVDEFQNFATSSFVKILSEARKYRLNLTLANQYIGQIDEEVQKAIFGNAGSLASFSVGAKDALSLVKEFGSIYKEEELVGLNNYQIVLRLVIDDHISSPFLATTLPFPKSRNQNRDKVIRSSRERYAKMKKGADS